MHSRGLTVYPALPSRCIDAPLAQLRTATLRGLTVYRALPSRCIQIYFGRYFFSKSDTNAS